MSAEIPTVLVQTKNGPVLGRRRVTSDHIEYVCYRGIPFAKPPVGELRFKAPVPIGNWSEPIEALQQPSVAPALDLMTKAVDKRSSEDCLFLNIQTRCTEPNPTIAKRPVMLHIHGGGFTFCNTDEFLLSPEFLLRSDVVFVTVAYRLGALGFLSVPEPAFGVPGNAGLKDQALGMRWVRDNIAAFGGDPENVTLFGISAGAASVHFHMLTDYSRGLFQRAIVQSGNAMSMWAQQAPPSRDLNGQLARQLGWDGEGGVEGMMRVLCAADARDIVLQQNLDGEADKQRGHYFMFAPTVEPYGAGTPECFLPRKAEELAPTAWGNAVPMICGFTTDEGYLFYDQWKRNERMFNDDGYFLNAVPQTPDTKLRTQLAERLVRAYYGDEKPNHQNLDRFVKLQGDKFFLQGCIKSIRAREQQPGNAPTYLYRFAFDSALPSFTILKETFVGELVKGAVHGAELPYLFKVAFIDYTLPENSVELRVIDNMVNIWTTFAHTGNPNSAKLAAAGVGEWTTANKTDGESQSGYKCLNIDAELEVIDLPETQRMAVWDELERDALGSFGSAKLFFEKLSK